MVNESNTAYDDVFRTTVNDCPRLVLPVCNELFNSGYTGNEIIVKTEYPISVMKIKDYTLDMIFEKKLYFIIPFYIFTYEKELSTRCTLLDMSRKVVRSLLGNKYPKVRKGVEEAMGGNILEYEAKTILNKGKMQGRLEGEKLFAKLISRLIEDNRNKDVALAANDEDARKCFYREYGMIE